MMNSHSTEGNPVIFNVDPEEFQIKHFANTIVKAKSILTYGKDKKPQYSSKYSESDKSLLLKEDNSTIKIKSTLTKTDVEYNVTLRSKEF